MCFVGLKGLNQCISESLEIWLNSKHCKNLDLAEYGNTLLRNRFKSKGKSQMINKMSNI